MSKSELTYEDLKVGMQASFAQLRNLYGVYVYFDDFDRETHSGAVALFFKAEDRTKEDDKFINELEDKNNGLSCHFMVRDNDDYDFYGSTA